MFEDNIEGKLKNIEEWNSERAKVKPMLDAAIDYHNKARHEAYWKHYEQAMHFYREAIKNYKDTLDLKPKYYLKDIMERLDSVIEEHVNNTFNLKSSKDKINTEYGIRELVDFIENLTPEEQGYIDPYDIAINYLNIADMYYDDDEFDKAYDFYNRVLHVNCSRSFVNSNAHYKTGKIHFYKKRFKEALVSFVSVLSFDRNYSDAVEYIDKCLKALKIYEHRSKFLSATPNEAKKLIMEVL